MTTTSRHPRRAPGMLTALSGLLALAFVVGACSPGGTTPTPSPDQTSAAAPSSDALGGLPPASPGAMVTPPAAVTAAPATPVPTPVTPPPAVTGSPAVTPPPAIAEPEPEPEPFEMNLYRRGDFVAQHTFE